MALGSDFLGLRASPAVMAVISVPICEHEGGQPHTQKVAGRRQADV